MKGLKQSTRNAIAYIATNHAEGTFTTFDMPKEHRRAMSGVVNKGHVQTLGVTDRKCRTYRITDKGRYYANRFASDEMEMIL
jgi:hypothetical protein